jgi:hypothetical protein
LVDRRARQPAEAEQRNGRQGEDAGRGTTAGAEVLADGQQERAKGVGDPEGRRHRGEGHRDGAPALGAIQTRG